MTFQPFSTIVFYAPNSTSICEPSPLSFGFPLRLNNSIARKRARQETHHGFKPMCVVNVYPKPLKESDHA